MSPDSLLLHPTLTSVLEADRSYLTHSCQQAINNNQGKHHLFYLESYILVSSGIGRR